MMSKQSSHLLAAIRRLVRPSGRTKVAELGGDGKDTQFEQAFSNLAHAFLKDKAPSLLDYEVGFQLMERNEDNTKAVGIFGFKVGSQWLYAPCFFLSGDLKGHELLYIKNQDQFLPLKENWLNHLLQKRPNILGKEVEPNLTRLGVMSPELSAFSRPPSKYASHVKVGGVSVPTEMVPGMAAFAHFGRTNPLTDPKYKDVIDVPTFLKKEGQAVIVSLIRDLMAFPKLASAFEKFYGGLGCIQDAIKEAKAREARLSDILSKEGLARLEFGQMSPDQRGQAPSQANGGVLSTGHDAFSSLDGYIQRPAWDRSRQQFYKTAFKDPTSPLTMEPPAIAPAPRPSGVPLAQPPEPPEIAPAPRPAGGSLPSATNPGSMGGGVLTSAPQVPPGGSPIRPGPTGAENPYGTGESGMTGGAGTGAPSIEEAPGGAVPPPPPRGFIGRNLDRANNWLDGHASWLPSKLPGGRATSALLGVGGIAAMMSMMAARRRKKNRDEQLAAMMAKESGSRQYKRRGPEGPFEQFIGPANTSKKKGAPRSVLDVESTGSSVVEKKGALAIITHETFAVSGVMEDISDEEKAKVKLEGVAFRDERPENSIAYEVTGPLKLSTPHETGIYHMLTQPGTFEECLVVIGPQGPKGAADFATVFATSGKKKWLNIHPAHLWCKSDEVSPEAYRKWLDGLSKPGSLKPSYSAVYMLVGPNGDCTLPFEVRKAIGGDDAVDSYEVSFRDWASRSRPGNLPAVASRSGYDDSLSYCCSNWYHNLHITNKEGGRIRTTGSGVYVPGDYKLVTLLADDDKEDERPRSYRSDSSDPQPLNPGTMLDVTKAIYEKTAELRIVHSGTVVEVNGYPMDREYVVGHLVRDWALKEKQARDLVKNALDARRFTCRVKLAAGLPDDPTAYHVGWLRDVDDMIKQAIPGDPMDPMMQGMTSAPPFPSPPTGSEPTLNGSVPAQYPQSETVPAMPANPATNNTAAYDPRTPPDPQTMQTGMQAAQTGQKEVFDTAMVGSLLKAVRDDTMVDRHLGDLMKGLDRIGRILFSFYWHGEEFQERYGKKDMPELEDSLRNAFEQLGDVVLFLKQKTVEPFPEEAAGADLSSTAQV
jgi:hypothetical protein